MVGGQVTDKGKLCALAEGAQRYTQCRLGCAGASASDARKDPCVDGCGFWI